MHFSGEGLVLRTISSLEKGLKILEIIAEMPEGARVKDISANLDTPTSNITLFLNALVNSGFVTKDTQAGCYFASQKFVETARKAELTKYHRLRYEAYPHMKRLRDELDENVLLAVISGHETQFLERLESGRMLHIRGDVDTSYPPHATAGGKAILAFLSPQQQRKYLESALYLQITEKTIVDRVAMQNELDEIRSRGYAINRGESEREIMAVGAPIREGATVVASIVVQFPTFRYQEDDLLNFGDRIMAASRAVEASLALK